MNADPSLNQGSRRTRGLRLAGRAVVGVSLLLFLALLAYGLATRAPDTGIDQSLAQAKPAAAPAFELPVLQRGDLGPVLSRQVDPAFADGRVAIKELRGTPVILNFWASWCVPCRVEAPRLERTWRQQRPRGVLMLGLNMQDLTGDARDFIREFHNTYPDVRDQSNGVAHRWGVTGLPETYFVTARGRVVGHVIGVISDDEMRAGIAALRSGKPIGAVTGGDQRPTR